MEIRQNFIKDMLLHIYYLDQRKEIYKGKEIAYDIPATTQKDSTGVEVHLKIDHEDLHVIRMEDGTYGTHLLPFQNYGSIEQLAKDVIDKVPQFRKRSTKQSK
jgi:hypothetical protein